MSLSKIEKLVKVAVIDGNMTVAGVVRLLQPSNPKVNTLDALAYTDGKAVYVHDDFWNSSVSEQYFIVCHEFLHIVLNHVERGKGKRGLIYNIAGDIVINDILHKKGRVVPEGSLTYEMLNVPRTLKTTEEIYKFLLQSNQENFKDMPQDLYGESPELEEVVKEAIEKLADEASKGEFNKEALREHVVSVPQDFRKKVEWFDDLTVELGRLAARTNIKTYSRPSRVKIDNVIMRGGFVEQSIPKINVIIDVSGSMGNKPLKIAAKIHEMQAFLKVFKPTYYWLNTNYGKIDDITQIPLGGGTDLSHVTSIVNADMNVLITDCEDDSGVDAINQSNIRFYIVTDNTSTKITKSHNRKIFFTNDF